MTDLLIGLIVIAVIALALLAVAAKFRVSRSLPVKAKRLMTAREREVIAMIEASVPHCRVHAQVAMGALVDCKTGLSPSQRTAVRNRFDRKVVDFVLEDRSSGDVLALVELDDRTHSDAKDRARDEITAAAGYRTVRLPAGRRHDAAGVRAQIVAALSATGDSTEVGGAGPAQPPPPERRSAVDVQPARQRLATVADKWSGALVLRSGPRQINGRCAVGPAAARCQRSRRPKPSSAC